MTRSVLLKGKEHRSDKYLVEFSGSGRLDFLHRPSNGASNRWRDSILQYHCADLDRRGTKVPQAPLERMAQQEVESVSQYIGFASNAT